MRPGNLVFPAVCSNCGAEMTSPQGFACNGVSVATNEWDADFYSTANEWDADYA